MREGVLSYCNMIQHVWFISLGGQPFSKGKEEKQIWEKGMVKGTGKRGGSENRNQGVMYERRIHFLKSLRSNEETTGGPEGDVGPGISEAECCHTDLVRVNY